jgi:hypothetical protein
LVTWLLLATFIFKKDAKRDNNGTQQP